MLSRCRVGTVGVPTAALGGSNASVSGVATGVADKLRNERVAASTEVVADIGVTEVIG